MANQYPSPIEDPIAELLAGYVLENLSPEEYLIVDRYLAEHPDQLQEITKLQTTLSILPFYLPESSPLPALRHRLLSSQSPWNLTLKQLLTLTTTLLAMGVAWLTWDSFQLRQQVAELETHKRTTDLLAMSDNRLLSFKAIDAKHASSGSLVLAPQVQNAFLVIQNLATLPKEKVYSLWLISNNGEKFYCQYFIPNKSGQVRLQIPITQDMVQIHAAVITIEKANLPQFPLGPMVLRATSTL